MDFFDMLKRIGIFIICARAIIQFIPDDSYEKYFRILVSVIVLVLFLSPILNLLGTEDTLLTPKEYENVFEFTPEEINSRFNNQEDGKSGPVVIEPVEVGS